MNIIVKVLNRVSRFIYRSFCGKRKVFSSQSVRENLITLNYDRNINKLIEDYYVSKISLVILLALCGCFLALVLHFSTLADTAIEDDGSIMRNPPGGREQEYSVVARDTDGEVLGEYDLVVKERKFTRKEADELFEKASMEIEKEILGENQSLDEVRSDLRLVEKLEGYPFSISWTVDNPDVMRYSGEIVGEPFSDEGEIVMLSATYKYDGMTWMQVLYAKVLPIELSPQEALEKRLRALIESGEEETKYDERLILPGTFEGESVIWSEKSEDNSLLFLLLMLVTGALTFVLKDKELQKKIEERQDHLKGEYPQFVSQLVLYLGAGMTMRNVFNKLSDDYLAKRKEGREKSYLYEEIVRTSRELSLGKSESEAYTDFGYRCGGQQYTRLCTLLTQNLRKGNSELLSLLNDESRRAFEELLDSVRKKGEEAGTKLLLPMTLMLLIVMVIIMIPAYMSF